MKLTAGQIKLLNRVGDGKSADDFTMKENVRIHFMEKEHGLLYWTQETSMWRLTDYGQEVLEEIRQGNGETLLFTATRTKWLDSLN